MVDCILLIPKGADQDLVEKIIKKLGINKNGYSMTTIRVRDAYYEIEHNVAVDYDTSPIRFNKPIRNILSFHNKIIEVW